MRRAGYEADRRELLVYDRAGGKVQEVAPEFDSSVGPVAWSPDGKLLYFSAEEKGRRRIFAVESGGGTPRAITEEATDADPVVSPDGEWIVFARQTMSAPPELFTISRNGERLRPLTRLNRAILEELDLPDPADFWYEGAKGARVHGMLLKPPGFETGKRYPVVFLIHGGPQAMFGLDFHERWNNQLFASRGWVVVTINPRGSTGYGQEFTDAIRGEWGGACYEDLIRGFDYVLETFSFCDPGRTAAAGASFGGYMVNWINGKTDRFRCLVSHDGIMNTEMMDYATDELWFTEWEFRGTPWESPEEYLKWSPHLHVGKMETPMLVIQGEQDFRCVVTEGTTLFTALKRRGVPARFLYLPDEGHWVLKPRNRQVWYRTVLDWLARYLEA
jgi:dipeptidyl aminopeptidase/acylaminoacyl peptidase